MNIKLILALTASLSLSACATGLRSIDDKVEITSQPSKARIWFETKTQNDRLETCITPCRIELSRQETYQATVSKSGYEDFVFIMAPKVSDSGAAATIGSLLLRGPIGAGADVASGGLKDLSPDYLEVTLAPTGGTSYATDKEGVRLESFTPATTAPTPTSAADDSASGT